MWNGFIELDGLLASTLRTNTYIDSTSIHITAHLILLMFARREGMILVDTNVSRCTHA